MLGVSVGWKGLKRASAAAATLDFIDWASGASRLLVLWALAERREIQNCKCCQVQIMSRVSVSKADSDPDRDRTIKYI